MKHDENKGYSEKNGVESCHDNELQVHINVHILDVNDIVASNTRFNKSIYHSFQSLMPQNLPTITCKTAHPTCSHVSTAPGRVSLTRLGE